MKIAVLIARLLLGLIFVFFGANGFLQFLPAPPMPPGPVGQFFSVFFQSHWVLVVSGFQVVAGLLLLVNRYVPLALALLAPILVNIWCYHLLLSMANWPLALVATVLWIFLFVRYFRYFASLFVQKTT
jgi:putative oxidoreductase